MTKQKVLFVCVHNSARSQMAEELLRKLAGGRFDVESAGIEPGQLNPVVVDVLKEEGIDISGKQTRSVQTLLKEKRQYDYVVTVCDETAADRCPLFPGKHQRLHWGFEDPSQVKGSDEEKFSRTRDIKEKIKAAIQAWINQ
jgi:arsenate reductase